LEIQIALFEGVNLRNKSNVKIKLRFSQQ